MKSFEIDNVKKFTSALFVKDAFDSFCITEASFSTLVNIDIDGHVNREFEGESNEDDDMEGSAMQDTAVKWSRLRSLCYEIIKGNRVPLRFKLVFIMPRTWIEQFMTGADIGISAENVTGLFLNVRFEGKKLSCTTGTSMNTFTMDRSLDEAWDRYMSGFIADVLK